LMPGVWRIVTTPAQGSAYDEVRSTPAPAALRWNFRPMPEPQNLRGVAVAAASDSVVAHVKQGINRRKR